MDSHADIPAPRAASPAPAVPHPGGPHLLLSTGSLVHLPLPEIACIAAAAGFAGLDLVMGSPRIAPGPAVSQAHALCPVRVVHAPFRNWSAWGGHMDAWRAAMALAASLRCEANNNAVHVTLHPPAGTLRDAIQTRWFARAENLPRLLGAPDGVTLSLENLPWAAGAGGLFNRDPLDALLSECRDKDLGLTLDVCHLGVSGRDVLQSLERIPCGADACLIRHVHFSDASGFTEHLPPGTGTLPLGPFLARLGALGYAGTISLELDPAHLQDETAAQTSALAALRQDMRRALAGSPPPHWAGQEHQGGARPVVAAFG